jgi:hypothetical protein
VTAPSKRPAYANRYAKLHRSGYRVMVDATATRRRAQALVCIGYTQASLGPALGIADRANIGRFLNGRGDKVTREAAKTMAEFYEAHCMTLVTTPGGRRAAAYARKHLWIPPLGWNDIDNPLERRRVRR